MPTRADPFLDASKRLNLPPTNPLPVFGAQFGQETVLNSSPYVLSYDKFCQIYRQDDNRLMLLDILENKLKYASSLGLIIDIILVGGSFIRIDETPKDIDILGFYYIETNKDPEKTLRQFELDQDILHCDLKICPIDCGIAVILKRALFFSNIFSYDKKDKTLKFGTLLVDTRSLMPEGVSQ